MRTVQEWTRLMNVRRTCPVCGYSRSYTSEATARIHFARHSCERSVSRAAAATRDARAAGGPRRECLHRGTPHRHGTRSAYVKDRCRCRPCMDANTAAGRVVRRAQAFGRWQPYVDAAPVREHIAALRAHGIGLHRIARLANTSVSHIRALAAKNQDAASRRVRPTTAERILAIEITTASYAPSAPVDATGTRRRLQALVAIGWPLARLGEQLDRTTAAVARSMRNPRVNAATARAVADLYDQLSVKTPPQATPTEQAASNRARAYAERRGWLPPLAWDDIDNDPEPDESSWHCDDEGIDEIAVERAVAGDGLRLEHLNRSEQAEVIRRLTEHGKSIRDIADQLKTTARTVARRRRAIRAA